MLKTEITCNKDFVAGTIDARIYGSFLEHMGRVIYGGIYEPGHAAADACGYRTDVLEKVKAMGVSCVRYPGGNFVSSYHWEDGVGPRKQRPRKVELAWRSIETNEFGTREFYEWAKKAQVEPIFTVNLGTRGVESAVQYLEYCNFPGGTQYSELRKSHGMEQPYGVKLWCLGNEMDGEWQIGHKTAQEYGRLAAEAGRAMKRLDDSIELVVCGSSLSTMPTYPQWDITVLEETYEIADYLALHQYYGGQEKGTKEFLAQTLDMEEYIRTIRAAAQVVKQKKHSKKTMKFSIDEWGVWSVPNEPVDGEKGMDLWKQAPAIGEQIYSLEDALLFAGMQMVMLRNADVVKIACQSLITNISACIMTEKDGCCWLQTIYYPFYYFANYARGVVLNSVAVGDTYESVQFADVLYIDQLVVWNEDAGELAVFLVNRSETETVQTHVCAQGFALKELRESAVLTADDKKQTNMQNHEAVVPHPCDNVTLMEHGFQVASLPLSFQVVRIGADRLS